MKLPKTPRRPRPAVRYRPPRGAPDPADRRVGKVLPDPVGWFWLAFSPELPRGAVLTRQLAGREVVLYRTHGGTLRAVGPYCPHLGAHLGAVGRIEGENLVCGFHSFAYGPGGSCVRTAYGEPPPQARLVLLHAEEVSGAVYVWHGPAGQEPSWHMPALPTDSGMAAFRYTAAELAGHPQEVFENLADYAHLSEVHGFFNLEAVTPLTFDGITARAAYRVDRRLPLVGTRSMQYTIQVNGLGRLDTIVDVPQLGFRTLLCVHPTVTSPGRMRLGVSVTASTKTPDALPRPVGRLVARVLSQAAARVSVPVVMGDFRPDFAVWNHKTYLEHPRLNAGDGPVMAYRRWANQFYPDASGKTEREDRDA